MTVYLNLKHAIFTLLLVGAAFIAPPASAAIIYESATLGQTGITSEEAFIQQTVPGANVDSTSFYGVRFFVNQPSQTTQIGGHFVISPSNIDVFFGAIVQLDDENDFPDSDDLSTPDVLGATLLTFPEPSDQVFGELSLSLTPGWYAVVFGAGLFGSVGDGGALRNNSDIGSPDYIGFQFGFGWGTRLPDAQFVVEGNTIPESTTLVLSLMALGSVIVCYRRLKH